MSKRSNDYRKKQTEQLAVQQILNRSNKSKTECINIGITGEDDETVVRPGQPMKKGRWYGPETEKEYEVVFV